MKRKYSYMGLVLAGLLTVSSCQKDFLDINTDPKNPTDLPLTQILPAAEVALGFNLSMNIAGINSAASTFVHQTANFRVDEYIVDGTTFSTAWSSSGATYGLYSGPLNDLEIIINKGTAQGASHYVGVAQVQKAYLFSILVDLFGDVPYSEALKGNEFLTPKFDSGADIYDNLLKLLDQAIVNLNSTSSSLSPDATTDIIYNGNRVRWVKLANTLKLKLLNQIRRVKNTTADINALIAANNLISAEAEDFQIRFGTSAAPENRNPGFVANYNAAGQPESFVNVFFYNQLKNSNDPRMPYYIYNQIATAATPTANPTDFRDGRFISRRFASQGPNKTFDQRTTQSLIGLFPIGGRYDDGVGGRGALTSGPGDAPVRLLTSYHVKFILAEAALTLGTTGNPRTLLEEGIRAQFAKLNTQRAAVPSSIQTVPAIPAAAIDTYVNSVLASYDAANAAGKLNVIMTQKWIASFGYAIDAYTDYRRTGFPVMPDPATDADPETISSRTYANRFPYPNSEVTSNPKAPAQPDIYTTKIFWAQ